MGKCLLLSRVLQGSKRELQEACESARNRGQDAHVAQLAAETKASILEGRVKECERTVRAKQIFGYNIQSHLDCLGT